jgi:hypothetical protein
MAAKSGNVTKQNTSKFHLFGVLGKNSLCDFLKNLTYILTLSRSHKNKFNTPYLLKDMENSYRNFWIWFLNPKIKPAKIIREKTERRPPIVGAPVLWSSNIVTFIIYINLILLSGIETSSAETIKTKANAEIIKAKAFGSTITLKTSLKFSGAVNSLVFRGMEFVDTTDHGRLLQSAVSFNGLGECYNPTEGGSAKDSKVEESSKLLSTTKIGNKLWTFSYMGYWLEPNYYYESGCNGDTSKVYSENKTIRSNVLLEKQVVVGLTNFPNVIVHNVAYHVSETYESAVFEASTIYATRKFTKSIYYNLTTSESIDPNGIQGEQQHPIILYSEDEKNAIGIYSPNLPQNYYGDLVGYGWFGDSGLFGFNKSNCVFRSKDVNPNSYKFQCMYAVGTLKEVKETLIKLNSVYKSTGSANNATILK